MLSLREYPRGFGAALVKALRDELPEPCLRQKRNYHHRPTDFELFDRLETGDTWPDARAAEVFHYLYTNKRTVIPPEWKDTMASFRRELKEVAQWQWIGSCHVLVVSQYVTPLSIFT